MQNKFPTIKDRILYLAEIKGFGKKNFCEKIGMSYGSFTGQAKNTPLNSNAIANILCIVPDVHGTTPEKNIPPPRWRGIS